jgi:transposase
MHDTCYIIHSIFAMLTLSYVWHVFYNTFYIRIADVENTCHTYDNVSIAKIECIIEHVSYIWQRQHREDRMYYRTRVIDMTTSASRRYNVLYNTCHTYENVSIAKIECIIEHVSYIWQRQHREDRMYYITRVMHMTTSASRRYNVL